MKGIYRICYYDRFLGGYVVVAIENDYYDGVIMAIAKAKQTGRKCYLFNELDVCIYSVDI